MFCGLFGKRIPTPEAHNVVKPPGVHQQRQPEREATDCAVAISGQRSFVKVVAQTAAAEDDADDAEEALREGYGGTTGTSATLRNSSLSSMRCSSKTLLESDTSAFWLRKLHDEPDVLCPANNLFTGFSRVRFLGAGGFGSVFRARWCHVDVAVKVLASTDDHIAAEMSRTESRLCESLRHPSVVQVFQTRKARLSCEWLDAAMQDDRPIGEEACSAFSANNENLALPDPAAQLLQSGDGFGSPDPAGCPALASSPAPSYLSMQQVLTQVGASAGCCLTIIIMELGNKGTLDKAMNAQLFNWRGVKGTQRRRQIYRAGLRTLREVAQGLAALHAMDVVHCDLKPTNVVLKASRSDWRGFSAAVCDFGLSKVALPELLKSGKINGTPMYMSPEALKGAVCKQSDIWAWGLVMLQLCTGNFPFKDIPSGVMVEGIKAGKLTPKWPQGQMPELQPLYEWCMQHEPERRPSASEVVKALIEVENQLRLRLMEALAVPDEACAAQTPKTT